MERLWGGERLQQLNAWHLFRKWNRVDSNLYNITASYTYDKAGRLTATTYNDGTPGVTTIYDRAGRIKKQTDAGGEHNFTYTPTGTAPVQESVTGGVLGGLALEHKQDVERRMSGARWRVEGADGAGIWHETAYTYDSQSRLAGATLEGVEASYTYAAGRNAVSGLTRPVAGAASAFTGAWGYDAAGRVDTLLWQRAGTVYGGHDYAYDNAGRRTDDVRADGMKVVYAYNDRGELSSAHRVPAGGGAALPGWSQGYLYDVLGNAVSRTTPEGETLVSTTMPGNWLSLQTAPMQRWLRGRANRPPHTPSPRHAHSQLDPAPSKAIS